jgi:hypothetical protein
MAKIGYDGVIEAVRYSPDGRLSLARVYERRGPSFSDRILLGRDELIKRLESGDKYVLGKRIPRIPGTFEVTIAVRLVKDNEGVVWISTQGGGDHHDDLEGAPIF